MSELSSWPAVLVLDPIGGSYVALSSLFTFV